jgi:Zn-finger nucleic acid-binding protein
MKCPVCSVDLSMSDRQGVEIDYCPQCRGVWLDRGELDKIIERSVAQEPGDVRGEGREERTREEHRDHEDHGKHDDRDYGHGNAGHGKKGKGSFLGQLFDLGGGD